MNNLYEKFFSIPVQIKLFKKRNKYIGGKIVLKKRNKVIVSFLDVKNNRVEVEFVQYGRAA